MASPVPADRLDEPLEETLVESAAAALISIFRSLLDMLFICNIIKTMCTMSCTMEETSLSHMDTTYAKFEVENLPQE